MNLGELIRAVEAECDDRTFLRERLVDFINDAILDIAERVRLPELIVSDTLVAAIDSRELELPDTYHHNLFECWNRTSEDWCSIVYSMKDIFRIFRKSDTRSFENQLETVDSYSKVTGDITHIAVNGRRVTWLPIPEEENELEVKYYRKPPVLSDDDDEPESIPANLHRQMIVSWVMIHHIPLYNLTVQEDRALMLRQRRYERDYEIGLVQLRTLFPYAPYKYPELKRTRIWF